jgi:integrase/recombinase XerD
VLYPKLKGLQPKTVEAYARAIRRAGNCFDHQIDGPIEVDLVDRFTDLRETHSRSSVKLDLYGLKFHYEHVLREALGATPV